MADRHTGSGGSVRRRFYLLCRAADLDLDLDLDLDPAVSDAVSFFFVELPLVSLPSRPIRPLSLKPLLPPPPRPSPSASPGLPSRHPSFYIYGWHAQPVGRFSIGSMDKQIYGWRSRPVSRFSPPTLLPCLVCMNRLPPVWMCAMIHTGASDCMMGRRCHSCWRRRRRRGTSGGADSEQMKVGGASVLHACCITTMTATRVPAFGAV